MKSCAFGRGDCEGVPCGGCAGVSCEGGGGGEVSWGESVKE